MLAGSKLESGATTSASAVVWDLEFVVVARISGNLWSDLEFVGRKATGRSTLSDVWTEIIITISQNNYNKIIK